MLEYYHECLTNISYEQHQQPMRCEFDSTAEIWQPATKANSNPSLYNTLSQRRRIMLRPSRNHHQHLWLHHQPRQSQASPRRRMTTADAKDHSSLGVDEKEENERIMIRIQEIGEWRARKGFINLVTIWNKLREGNRFLGAK